MNTFQLQREIEGMKAHIQLLEYRLSKIPVRAIRGGGGAGFFIETHATFPAIPSTPKIISCKNQLWYAEDGYTHWYPCVGFTSETGEVGT